MGATPALIWAVTWQATYYKVATAAADLAHEKYNMLGLIQSALRGEELRAALQPKEHLHW